MNKIYWLIALLITLTGCNKKFVLFNNNPDRYNLNNLNFEDLTLKTKIQYSNAGQGIKGTANIRIKKDSVIWFSLTPGFGIEAARGVINKDSIVIINKINQEYEILHFAELSEKFNFDLNYHLIESVLIGNLIYTVESKDDIEKENGYHIISKNIDGITILNYIGTTSKKLERIEATKDVANQSLSIVYGEFETYADKILPTLAEIEIKYKRKSDNIQKISNITLKHTKIEIDTKNLRFDFAIPAKYDPK